MDKMIEVLARAMAPEAWQSLDKDREDYAHEVTCTRSVYHASAAYSIFQRREEELVAVAREAHDALDAMMNTWLDYHDAHNLTQPVTGASANAFDKALEVRDKIAALSTGGSEPNLGKDHHD